MGLSHRLERANSRPATREYYKHQQQALFLDYAGDAGLVERKNGQGQLGSGRHDRARQRAGHRTGPWLALGRAGRAVAT